MTPCPRHDSNIVVTSAATNTMKTSSSNNHNRTSSSNKASSSSLTEAALEELESIRPLDPSFPNEEERSVSPRTTLLNTTTAHAASTSTTHKGHNHHRHRSSKTRPRPSSSTKEAPSSSLSTSSRLRLQPSSSSLDDDHVHMFPPRCAEWLVRLPGNDKCVDCGEPHPQWASVSYGVLLCLQCSGRHRGLGVQTSFVRSVFMDSWSHAQILAMLEGGNEQLHSFFHRHSLSSSAAASSFPENHEDSIVHRRYRTKAAQFYRENLAVHVAKVSARGRYLGREAQRGRGRQRQKSRRSKSEHVRCAKERTRRSCSTEPAPSCLSKDRTIIPCDKVSQSGARSTTRNVINDEKADLKGKKKVSPRRRGVVRFEVDDTD